MMPCGCAPLPCWTTTTEAWWSQSTLEPDEMKTNGTKSHLKPESVCVCVSVTMCVFPGMFKQKNSNKKLQRFFYLLCFSLILVSRLEELWQEEELHQGEELVHSAVSVTFISSAVTCWFSDDRTNLLWCSEMIWEQGSKSSRYRLKRARIKSYQNFSQTIRMFLYPGLEKGFSLSQSQEPFD